MNRDQIQGNFNQIKGKAKRIWGELTDDDCTRAEGSADKLYGIIQERFGDSKEAIKRRIDDLQLPSSAN
ncbi:MAG: CsbD family protein [Nannocystaceae bacterium]